MEQPFVFSRFESEYERYSAPRQAKASFISLRNAWNKGNMDEVRRHAGVLEPKMRDAKREMPNMLVRQLSFLKKIKEKPKVKKTLPNSNATHSTGTAEKELAVSGSGFESPTATTIRLPPLTVSSNDVTVPAGNTKTTEKPQTSPRRSRGTMKDLEEKIQQLEKWIQGLHEGLQADSVETLETQGARPGKGKPVDPIYQQMSAIVETVKHKKVQVADDAKKLKKDLKTKEDQMTLLEKKIKKLEDDVKNEKLDYEETAPKPSRRPRVGGQTTDKDRDKDGGGSSPDIVASIRKTLQTQRATLTSSVQGMTTELKTKTDRLKDLENAVNQLSEDIKTEQYKKEEEPKHSNTGVVKKGRLHQHQANLKKKSTEGENGSVRHVMMEIKKHLRLRDAQSATDLKKLKEETQYAKERLEAEAGTRDIKTKKFGKQLHDDNKSLQRTLSEKGDQMDMLHKAIEEMYTTVQSDLGKDGVSAARGKPTTVKTQPEADALKLKDVHSWVAEFRIKIKEITTTLKTKEDDLDRLQTKTADIFTKVKQSSDDIKGTPRTSGGDKDFRRMLSDIQSHIDKPTYVKEKTFDVDNPPDKELEMINLKATVQDMQDTEKRHKQTVHSLSDENVALEKKLKDVQEKLDKTTNDNSSATTPSNGRVVELENKLLDVETEKESLLKRLSETLGSQVTSNNPDIADLSDSNRPTVLVDKFSELYDNEWTTTLERLVDNETSGEDEETEQAIETLLCILKDAYRYCRELADTQLAILQKALYSPAESLDPKNAKSASSKDDQHSVETAALLDIRKKTAVTSWSHVNSDFLRYLKSEKKYEYETLDKCSSYVSRCVELCWYMSLQAPPVVIDTSVKPGEPFDQSAFRHYTQSGKIVEFLVWPPLLLHEDGPLMAKGVSQGK